MFRSIRWKLVLIYLLLILFAMQLIGVYFIHSINSYFLDNFSKTIDSQTEILAQTILPKYLSNSPSIDQIKDMDYLVSSFVQVTGGEIFLLNKNGIIVSTSSNKSYVGQKRLRTEVTRSLLGTKDQTIRQDGVTGQRFYFLAVPVKSNGEVLGAVYVVAPMQSIYKTISEINWIFMSGTFIALALTAVLGIVLARTISSPIVEITKKAKAMAGGDFDQEVVVKGDDEIGQLGLTFNTLTHQLRIALSENAQEKDKMAAILTHMSEGVIAVSGTGIILLINPAAKRLLGYEKDDAIGLSLDQLLVLGETSGDMWRPLRDGQELQFNGPENRTLHAYASLLRSDQSEEPGLVIVLRDITEEERLEQASRDFVANVSHEIRTPLTTVKSYLEALTDGAVEDRSIRSRFLQVIQNETDRMVRLVGDLLQLSRLDAGQDGWNFKRHNIRELLHEVVDRFTIPCRRENITLQVDMPAKLPLVYADRDKIDQVLDNLLSNAIKYSPDRGTIKIAVSLIESNLIEIEVCDTGMGIPAKDLPRIFERFYRVEKARSRKLGGTGLGLSIAKQIIEAHGGMISIESAVNKGTTVRFTLPITQQGVA